MTYISPEKKQEMYEYWKNNGTPYKALAKEFGISHNSVHKIIDARLNIELDERKQFHNNMKNLSLSV